ncbi:HypC/HybG/HupF family hydrogenase formation chaperone [Chitinibacter sp. S2-10]|uniref:HypC/HybG/HupF family hydrogenase formation chaperone n=1 Tax=Chitinibacter sp. S2-10 TaxID=3373597 RepID=UPI003977A6DF
MCLALPARVISLSDDGFGIAELGGVQKRISLALLDEIAVGDYVILHVGYALARLDESEALATLKLFAELAESQENELLKAAL